MADFTSSPQGDAYYDAYQIQQAGQPAANTLTTLTNVTGAVVSLALVVGIGVWGYNLLMRDVSGIPVVQAASGEMRVRPEDPGGQLAQNQGLSVNAVAAEGIAEDAAETVRLAPQTVDVAAEDQPVSPQMVAPVQQQAAVQDDTQTELNAAELADTEAAPAIIADAAESLRSGNVDDLVAQLTDGVTPLIAPAEETTAAQTPEVVATVTEDVVETVRAAEAQEIAALRNAPGVRQSLRPALRPKVRAQITAVALTSTSPAPARFAEFMQGKQRVVQKATSGGRVFYRLRAMGFEDIADARRFCSALLAKQADCIPVVTR